MSRHSKNPKKLSVYKRSLRFPILSVVLLIIFVLIVSLQSYSVQIKNTNALSSDTERSIGNTFTAGIFGQIMGRNIFELIPGTTKACYITRPSPFPNISRLDSNGDMYLDFGEIYAGNSFSAPDVFRVKNTTTNVIAVKLEISDLAPLFSYVRMIGGECIYPGREKQVEMKLNTSPDTPPGSYYGTLTVSDFHKRQSEFIPIHFMVIAK